MRCASNWLIRCEIGEYAPSHHGLIVDPSDKGFSFWSVLWVDVGEHDAAEQAFMSIARRLKLQAQNLEEALQDLGGIDHSWLLFLDNADDPAVDYSQYFPPGSRGTVVLTSRNADCGRAYGRDHCEELACLDWSDAIISYCGPPTLHNPPFTKGVQPKS